MEDKELVAVLVTALEALKLCHGRLPPGVSTATNLQIGFAAGSVHRALEMARRDLILTDLHQAKRTTE